MKSSAAPVSIAQPSSRARPKAMAHSAPVKSARAAPPKSPSVRPRAPSIDPPEFMLPPSPPVFSAIPQVQDKASQKSYRKAFISSSCPADSNVPYFPAPRKSTLGVLTEGTEPNSPRLSESEVPEVPLGSSPTIMYVLKTMPGTSSRASHSHMYHDSNPIQQTPILKINADDSFNPEDDPSDDDDDEGIFGPLSFENDDSNLDPAMDMAFLSL